MNYRVIIGGHSQIPNVLPTLQDVQISVCRLPGGKLSDFWEHSKFTCMRENEHDLAIIFLGGNDVNNSTKPSDIINAILEIADYLKQRNKHVVVTLLEPRQYSVNNRFRVDSNTYDKVSRSINRALGKVLRKRSIRTLNFGAKTFAQGHTRDGVHFRSVTKAHITNKIINCIEHHRNKQNKK